MRSRLVLAIVLLASTAASSQTVIITKPHAGDIIYKGVSNIFAGQGSDFSEPLWMIPCADLTWTSTKAGDPKLTGCHPNFTFATVGVRTITLTGKDSQGTAKAKVTIIVADLQSGAAPAVTIQQPLNDSLFLPKHTATVVGVAVGKEPLTYLWKIKVGNSEVPIKIKQNPILSLWTPSDYLPWHCGTSRGELWLYVTDGDGKTGSDHVSVSVLYGPC
jgi:hypothetical protein